MNKQNKRIGIFTLYPRFNYGGILQCAALYAFLEQNGYTPILIQGPSRYKSLFKELVKIILERIPFQNIKNLRSNYKKECFHNPFINKNISNKTTRFYTQKALFKITEKYDLSAVIVGSDQVWRMDYINGGYYQNYFLDFVVNENVKKIAYSASFGKDIWDHPALNSNVSHLLKSFDAISVRELSGIGICHSQFNINNVVHTLDPTLLVDTHVYDKFISQTDFLLEEDSIVTYILDPSSKKHEIVVQTQQLLNNKKLFDLNNSEMAISVPIWVKSFQQADFIITDSFHGMVFAIIFNKPFIVIANEERGLDRFTSLLSKLGLENRLIFNEDKNKIYNLVLEQINYKDINEQLSIWRLTSENYLISNLL